MVKSIFTISIIYKGSLIESRRLRQAPSNGAWIWTENGFAHFEDVFKDKKAQSLEPFLHTLQKDWMDYPIFGNIQQELDKPKLLQVLRILKALEQPGEQLPSSWTDSIWTTVTHLISGTENTLQQRLEVACHALKYLHQKAECGCVLLGPVTAGRSQETNSFPPSNHIESDLFDLCLVK